MERTLPLRKCRCAVAAALFALCFSWLVFAASRHADAQVRIPIAARETAVVEDNGALQALLAEGDQLERAGRWGEALNHYEGAQRKYPNRAEITQRLDRSRTRYDLARRYADRSFVNSLQTLSLTQSLKLYDELLDKINTHHVDSPQWRTLVGRGTFALSQALSDDAFLQENLRNATPQQIGAFRAELDRHLSWRPIRDAREASDAVSLAARLGAARLNVAPTAVVMEYIAGATGSLDNYSGYLTRDQLNDVFSQIEGNFVGLGVELKTEDDVLHVVNVIRGSPAEKAGLRADDLIVAVAGHATADVTPDKAADMLKGPEGSTVNVTVRSQNSPARVLQVRRERVEVPSVEDVRLVDKEYGVGYLKINSFQKTTSRDVDDALWNLHRQGMKSLIIDVRGNPGGLLTASVEVADKFVTDGVIVSTRGRSAREDFDYRAHRVGTWRVPLYVLIDGDSASASEIFAGAIHDHRRGPVIGERSYGKGSVQGIFPLAVGSTGVRLTTAKFYSPSGRAISKQGVVPTHVVHNVAKPVNGQVSAAEADPILAAGIQAARAQLSQR